MSNEPRKPAPIEYAGVRADAHRERKQIPGSWSWRMRATGVRSTYLGTVTGTRAQAQRKIARLHEAWALVLKPEPAEAGLAATVSDVLERWLKRQEERAEPDKQKRQEAGRTVLSPNSVACYRYDIGKLNRRLGTMIPSALDHLTLEAYRDARIRRDHASPNTVGRELRMLGTAWREGRRHGWHRLPDLPTVGVHVPRKRKPTPSPAEVAGIIAAIDPDWRLAAFLLGVTGARIGEITALRYGDLDLNAGCVTVDGKTGPRKVWLDPGTVKTLREHRGRPGAPIVPARYADPDSELRRRIGVACKFLGLAHYTPNAFRRAAVDRYRTAGVGLEVAAAQMGHSVKVLLAYYRQASEEEQREAAKRAAPGVGLGMDGVGSETVEE